MQNVKTDQFFLKVDVKNISLMAYYELNYTEPVISLIDSYKHFLTDNKFLTDEYKENNLRFVNVLYALTTLQDKDDKNKISDLKDRIMLYRNGKMEWLLEKIDLLEGR